MTNRPYATAALLLLTAAAAHHYRTLRRALTTERAAARITAATHHRDRQHLTNQLATVTAPHTILRAAETVIDSALTRHQHEEG
ncbi:hypothetical protein [Streptomyces sp. t39]|uniref:hypothetical protein n=1 Tax=Streptomyces sp. t39 TaxID=1828156 RepID=UPI0011CD5CA2|nr:hypothetical protein [Streptomyces sp. t39]TXS51643.1 hypothetical protein EAO77_27815 [Streptomyces sp. t39]